MAREQILVIIAASNGGLRPPQELIEPNAFTPHIVLRLGLTALIDVFDCDESHASPPPKRDSAVETILERPTAYFSTQVTQPEAGMKLGASRHPVAQQQIKSSLAWRAILDISWQNFTLLDDGIT